MLLVCTAGELEIHQVTSGSWGGVDGAATVSISDSTAYTIRAQVKQGVIFARLVGQSASIQTTSAITVIAGEPGLYSGKTGVKFDGERSERERAAIGKADRDVRDRPATCP